MSYQALEIRPTSIVVGCFFLGGGGCFLFFASVCLFVRSFSLRFMLCLLINWTLVPWDGHKQMYILKVNFSSNTQI